MGRHEAAEGASPHPLVAAALAGRSSDAAGGPRHEPRAAVDGGGLGWPGDEPAPGGGGLGWPDAGTEEQAATQQHAEATGPPAIAETPPRRGWRRLFGSAPAA
ncbi:hypothetical protein E9549_21880 [Blastococcus sp. MG754426]|uniref:hypothetical protein n=1 Tax=unclassified Blastococcus TaxID=2619396 RepID=UPI001EF080D0|nr:MULTISPECIES: hypothetical protein [unclassified Blastococcus]MCF6510018.1 hypothetical protein [Blastococcus sp. MG754426]MCF6514403.1 hypothetical protein [Blastococcus sp. MG754427]MCF6737445.1 hypothetical protein [Blastococcus sp. KM273129]